MKQNLLFLTLNVFSATGGIEKVCRTAGKALHEIASNDGGELTVYAMHDDQTADKAYLPANVFTGFGGHKLTFALAAIKQGRSAGTVLLSHVNLLPIGFAIKKISPKTKLVMMAHGIEVWEKFRNIKEGMLRAVDLFLPVSSFTAQKLQTVHSVPARKMAVLNNCLDPFLKNERNAELEGDLRKKYSIKPNDFVLLTVTRLKFSEQYKGYDKVVQAMATLQAMYPNLKYLIAGKWDDEEKARLDFIIRKTGVENRVIFAGFAKDDELSAHFHLADAYVMPSTGEGFGIVFTEALFYGLPVIAGSVDGSVDALGGGKFGLLVDPAKPKELVDAIKSVCQNRSAFIPDTREILETFGFDKYRAAWIDVLKRPTDKKAIANHSAAMIL